MEQVARTTSKSFAVPSFHCCSLLTQGSGNGNVFGNSNSILSGNSGLGRKVRKTPENETLGTYLGDIVDDITKPLDPTSSSNIWGSPSGDGNSNGSDNTAGSGNTDNTSGWSSHQYS
jgi:hypothetical protein